MVAAQYSQAGLLGRTESGWEKPLGTSTMLIKAYLVSKALACFIHRKQVYGATISMVINERVW